MAKQKENTKAPFKEKIIFNDFFFKGKTLPVLIRI